MSRAHRSQTVHGGRRPELPEFRRTDRHKVGGVAWLRTAGGVARGRLVDLSDDGVLIATDLHVLPGTGVRLRCFNAAGEAVGVWARAVRRGVDAAGRSGVGLRFADLEPETRVRLRQLFAPRAP